MSERPKPGADPDATVMLPASDASRLRDPDATVMIPAGKAGDDATVMIPAGKAGDDATVMIPVPAAGGDATVRMPAPRVDDDATVVISATPADDDATVMIPAAMVDPDATVMLPAQAASEPDPEATIAIPTPGRKRDPTGSAIANPVLPAANKIAPPVDDGDLGGLNALVAAANPVLVVAAQIRHALKHGDPEGLLAILTDRVAAFEAAARASGRDEATVASASLALCALVDESAASTPWGAGWLANGLLARRHGEQAGGEKVFQLLEQKSANPGAHRDLLEFFYVCLALGFEGRFRGQPEARQSLLDLRGRLLEQLRQLRPPRDGELSGRWRGLVVPARRPAGALGFWVAGAVAACFLAALYAGFSISLGGMSDPVARDIAQLKVPAGAPAQRSPAPAAATPRIAEQLAGEISSGEVAVVDVAGMSTIVIRSDRLFGSGSARLDPAVEPVVVRVAQALDRVPGTILVTGHTDDVPIRTARFPSNWELSTERAASVVALMAGKLRDPARLRAEGVADSAPSVPNDSAASRARNRRVEIILRSAP
jgi:type VI secretion system protein ImpK